MQTYQQPQQPTTRQTNTIAIALVTSWIIIGVGIRWVFFRESPDVVPAVDDAVETDSNTQRRYIGEKVLLSGVLQKREGFGMSTHIFIDSNDNAFAARSEVFNLNEYLGEVQIKAEVMDFDGATPIITIQDLIVAGADQEVVLPAGNDNFYYNQSAGLGIDLSASEGYSISETDGEVRLVESTNPTDALLTIVPFGCTPGDPLQDCEDLKQKFTDYNNQQFTNTYGITFYNLTETNTWFMFALPNRGYSLRSSDDNTVAGFSDLIQIMDDASIKSLVEPELQTYCKSLESSLQSIDTMTSKLIESGLLEVTLTGPSTSETQATCSVYVTLSERSTVHRGTYSDGLEADLAVDAPAQDPAIQQEVIGPKDPTDNIQPKPTEETLSDDEDTTELTVDEVAPAEDPDPVEDTASPTPAPTPLAVDTATVATPPSLDGWLQYSSVRGFEMYFSKQGVSYVGTILDGAENLGIDGVSCRYKVDVIQWKQADFVTESPDLAVFECTGTQPTTAQVTAAKVQLAGSTDEMFFLTQRYTDNLGDIQVYVE